MFYCPLNNEENVNSRHILKIMRQIRIRLKQSRMIQGSLPILMQRVLFMWVTLYRFMWLRSERLALMLPDTRCRESHVEFRTVGDIPQCE